MLLWLQWREGWPPPPGSSGTATSAKGCTVQRGGGGSCGAWGRSRCAAGSAQRRRRSLSLQPPQTPLYRVPGWAGGGKIPPRKCTLAVEKWVSRKLVPHWCLASGVRVLGGAGAPPESRLSSWYPRYPFFSVEIFARVFKGICSYLIRRRQSAFRRILLLGIHLPFEYLGCG